MKTKNKLKNYIKLKDRSVQLDNNPISPINGS